MWNVRGVRRFAMSCRWGFAGSISRLSFEGRKEESRGAESWAIAMLATDAYQVSHLGRVAPLDESSQELTSLREANSIESVDQFRNRRQLVTDVLYVLVGIVQIGMDHVQKLIWPSG